MAQQQRTPKPTSKTLAGEQPSQPAANLAGRPWDAVDELVKERALAPEMAENVQRAARRAGVTPTQIILQRRLTDTETVARAEASVARVQFADLQTFPLDKGLLEAFGPNRALRLGCAPWRRLGKAMLFVATSRASFERAVDEAPVPIERPILALCDDTSFAQAVTHTCRLGLIQSAESRTPAKESCRTLSILKWEKVAALSCSIALFILCFSPGALLTALTAIAVLTLAAAALLKAAALVAVLLDPKRNTDAKPEYHGLALADVPRISVMVPLYKETQIAQHLVARLQRLNYPRERLEVLLVTESDDLTTQDTLARTHLPHWMRQVSVPTGRIKTKPRALNYALDHCKGDIVGVYDAEDAPEPDQLLTIAAHFERADPDVACLQGRLDYYNPHQNWLSKCFTMEYAAWFRVVLPGLARLRLPVPLGGTTLFFRREPLEELGGWDAHNVTEDADLGLRLARRGYRTELANTVTFEEANCRAWPWVRQRSRWLKGYAITYATHMRAPRRLLADLGPWGFLGVQLLFGCTLMQFMLAPVLWSFWAILFGAGHPVHAALPASAFGAMVTFFVGAEVLNLAVTVFGVSRTQHRRLWPWAVTLIAYFPLGALAAYKGALEIAGRPFFWDKTSHGITLDQAPDARSSGSAEPTGQATPPGRSLAVSRRPYSSVA